MQRRRPSIPLLVVLFTGSVAVAFAQPGFVRAGVEFQVNTYTTGGQFLSTVAMDSAGAFVVVWKTNGQDGDGYGVFARRFTSNGTGQGLDFQVNLTTVGGQNLPDVAMDGDGDFVVVWQTVDEDGDGYGISGRRFDSAGLAQASEFLVNSTTTSGQKNPTVSMNASGGFVVAWASPDGGPFGYGVFGRRFDAAGQGLATEFRINNLTAFQDRGPDVAMASGGQFVVTWERYVGADYDVVARRFDAAGNAQGGDLLISAILGNQVLPVVGISDDGDFVIAWQSTDQSGFGVFARRFDAAAVALGAEFQVNTYTIAQQENPAVEVHDSGFVVAWNSNYQDGSVLGSFLRRFDNNGVALTGEIQINTFTTNFQSGPALAMDAAGDFVVTWASNHFDVANNEVFAQRFEALAVLDIDGNGETAPLTDGILVLRFLFGFDGPTLVAGAVDEDACTRCDATTIEEYLQTLV